MSIPTGEVESIEEEARRLRRRTEEYQREQQRGRRRPTAVPPPPTPAPAPTAAPTPDVLTPTVEEEARRFRRVTEEYRAAEGPSLLRRQAAAYATTPRPIPVVPPLTARPEGVVGSVFGLAAGLEEAVGQPNAAAFARRAGQVTTGAVALAQQQYRQVEAPRIAMEAARAQPQIGLGERLATGQPGTVAGEVPPLTQVVARYPRAFTFQSEWEKRLLAAGIGVGALGVGALTLAAAPLVLGVGAGGGLAAGGLVNTLLGGLLYFSAESAMEEMGWIPGQPITRLTHAGATPFRVGLEEAGVPKPVAAPVSELLLWLLAPVAGGKIAPRLLDSLRGISAEDAAKAVTAMRQVVVEG